jgi:WD40 repeat protein
MSFLAPPKPVVAELGRTFAFDAPVNGLAFIGSEPLFALGDGVVADGQGVLRRAHEGAILCAALAPDGRALLTGGDDGLLRETPASGESRTRHDAQGKWIDHLAASAASGAVAFSVGREVRVLPNDGKGPHAFSAGKAANAIALDAKGRRLAIAHADAVTLFWALGPTMPKDVLEWKGAHLSVAFSPDGAYVVTGMSEGALHGWRLRDKAHFRMTGYPFKPRALSFGMRGKALATSGAGMTLLWPFDGRDGPMGRSADQLRARPGLVTAVACHPKDPMLAAGYADGGVHLLRFADGADVYAAGPPPPSESPDDPLKPQTAVEHLVWSADGRSLAWGGQDGKAGWMSL